eukprot:CAMPEP_0115828238 /NCGR_PEP_ID=MMETSP0287-20121206/468_1 /TAXON_ID=412157 /ORGANISM="Chrysochromulina rotalis, Strain UIO044" /LENGTH=127 /DNA_ID=CAMNT_0003281443 /DNA_START=674 /DNA_END=1055 /DNA_ORIENTATION=+
MAALNGTFVIPMSCPRAPSCTAVTGGVAPIGRSGRPLRPSATKLRTTAASPHTLRSARSPQSPPLPSLLPCLTRAVAEMAEGERTWGGPREHIGRVPQLTLIARHNLLDRLAGADVAEDGDSAARAA